MLLVAGLTAACVTGARILREQTTFEEAVAKAFEVQILALQIAAKSRDAASGRVEAYEELRSIRDTIHQTIHDFNDGDPKSRPTSFKGQVTVGDALKNLNDRWGPIERAADGILSRKDLVVEVTTAVNEFNTHIIPLNSKMDEIVTLLREKGASADQIYIASRQLLLADRLQRVVKEIRTGDLAVTSGSEWGYDVVWYGRVIEGFLNGAPDIKVRALTDPTARVLLAELATTFRKVATALETIGGNYADYAEVTKAADDIAIDSQELLNAGRQSAVALSHLSWLERHPSAAWFLASLAAVVISLGVLLGRRPDSWRMLRRDAM